MKLKYFRICFYILVVIYGIFEIYNLSHLLNIIHSSFDPNSPLSGPTIDKYLPLTILRFVVLGTTGFGFLNIFLIRFKKLSLNILLCILLLLQISGNFFILSIRLFSDADIKDNALALFYIISSCFIFVFSLANLICSLKKQKPEEKDESLQDNIVSFPIKRKKIFEILLFIVAILDFALLKNIFLGWHIAAIIPIVSLILLYVIPSFSKKPYFFYIIFLFINLIITKAGIWVFSNAENDLFATLHYFIFIIWHIFVLLILILLMLSLIIHKNITFKVLLVYSGLTSFSFSHCFLFCFEPFYRPLGAFTALELLILLIPVFYFYFQRKKY